MFRRGTSASLLRRCFMQCRCTELDLYCRDRQPLGCVLKDSLHATPSPGLIVWWKFIPHSPTNTKRHGDHSPIFRKTPTHCSVLCTFCPEISIILESNPSKEWSWQRPSEEFPTKRCVSRIIHPHQDLHSGKIICNWCQSR